MDRLPRPAKRRIALEDLVNGLPGAEIIGSPQATVTGIELDSRLVEAGDCFAAIPGHIRHGADFVAEALAHGATAILTDAGGSARINVNVPVIVIDQPRSVLGELAGRVYGEPDLLLLGVTGTNGKTTVSYLVEAGLRAAGHRTGVIGTVGIRIGDLTLPSARTTPETVHLHALLAVMRERGIDAVSMEVSSHALAEGRVDGLRFAVAGFTNLSQDHLDYHGTMEAYFAAKARLFTDAHARMGIVGIDDAWGRRLAQLATIPVQTWTTEPQVDADWSARPMGGGLEIVSRSGERTVVEVPLPGAHNRANAVCAFAMLRAVGVPAEAAATGIAGVSVPGRMERIGTIDGVTGIVDYAHSPEAIERVLTSVRELTEGRVIAVIGAGGDRDRSKRPLMGAAAARLADLVVITDDNPRSEDPATIRDEVAAGAPGARTIADRRAAIGEAVAAARPGDLVIVLGKGHEQGQEIAGTTIAFDDRDELRAVLRGRR